MKSSASPRLANAPVSTTAGRGAGVLQNLAPDLFSQPSENKWPPDGWHCMPTGRWCTTILAHGGWLALHAWVEGDWAITRSSSRQLVKGDPFMIGSREKGQPKGSDLEDAMRLAEEAAAVIVERERKACQKQ